MKKSFFLFSIIFIGFLVITAAGKGKEERMQGIQDMKSLDLSVKSQDIQSTSTGIVKPDLNFGKFPLYFIFNKGQVNEKTKFYAKASRYTLWLTKEGLVFDSFRNTYSKSNSPHSPYSPNFKATKTPRHQENTKDKKDIHHSSLFTHHSSPDSPHSPKIEATKTPGHQENSKDKKGIHHSSFFTHHLSPDALTNHHSPITKYERDVSRLSFIGANRNPEIVPVDETQLRVNYFIGNDRSKWHCDVPTSQAVLYKNLYKNIDLKVYGIEKQIEYDWIVKPGGNAGDIRVEYKNVKGTRIDKEGNLLIVTDFGELMHKKPVSFQEIRMEHGAWSMEGKSIVKVKFKKIKKNTYGFEVGEYDKSYELIIDPVVLVYSTYLGGGSEDIGYGIAVDNSGNAYVTGITSSTDFPYLNPYQRDQDIVNAFVTKIDTNQSGAASLIYSTYLGGGGIDSGYGIAIDSSGNVYVTGITSSTDFPCKNQYMTDPGDSLHDAFVTKIDTTQSGSTSLIYSTYLGGGSSDYGLGIAVDSSGNAYVTGFTMSTDFSCKNQYQTDPGDSDTDAFVTKIDTNQSGVSSLIYSTYLGGGSSDYGQGIAVDSSGNAYVTGFTLSTDFPCKNQYQTYQGDFDYDAFVTKIDTNQSGVSSLIFSTCLGGAGGDTGYSIAVDSSGNAYVTGTTISIDFPCLNQYQTNQGYYDAFVTKIDTTQSGAASLIYSTYLGGGAAEWAYGIDVDSSSNVYVTGYTFSIDFPCLNQYQTDQGDLDYDAFVTKIDTTQSGASSLIYSTYLGGRGTDHGYGIAVDSSGNAYVTGYALSTDFPCQNQYMTDPGDSHYDAFVTKLIYTIGPAPPHVITKAVYNVTTTSALSGGNVFSDGGAAVAARGACWSTYPNPTVSESHTTDGTGIGKFTSSITGLTPMTTYHVRAYATNSVGTSYGNDVTFTTPPANLTISGTVMDGINPIEGVTITFSHNGHIETTDSDGYYSYTVAYGTSTTVTASKSGYTFTPSEYSFTNLTENKPSQDFTVLNYISVTITNPRDGDTVSGTVTITANVSSNDSSAAAAFILSVTGVEFYIDGELEKQDASSPYQYQWDTTLVSNGNHTIKAKALHSSGLFSEHEITVHVSNSTEPPHIELNRTRLNFGAVIGGSRTGSQTFLIENSGGCCLNWTAAISDTWINASPLSGTENMLVTVSVDVTGLVKGSYSGTVTITDTNADNSSASVDIFLKVMEKAQEMPPFGSFDSPLDGSVVTGSIPVTGWALDDVEVSNVKIFRNPMEGHENGLIYIGDAIFVEGARPDVKLQFPTYPKNYQAGWGYMLLTNMLPNQGNGTFVLTAIAADSSGHEVILDKKTITCDNEDAVKPFGAIDTPGQGGDASGMDFVNFGWALTPQPKTIPTDGSTINVWVDGVPLEGHPVYNQYRKDIATLFSGYNNSNGAVGYYTLDTTLYANGVHTIAWSVMDDAGNSDGIGSRYFRILNKANKTNAQTSHKYNSMDVLNIDLSFDPVYLKRGYYEDSAHKTLYPDREGMIDIVIKEDERIEIRLRDQGTGSTMYFGYLSIGQELRRLPIGSFLDSWKGIFYWQPGPGYIGMYNLVFIEKNSKGKTIENQIRITITPKFK